MFNTQAIKRGFVLSLAVVFASTLSACTEYAVYKKCGWSGCPGDAELTAGVQAAIEKHPALLPPDRIDIQTLDRVVYLNGLVDTDLEKYLAESAALEVPGVIRVVNSIAVRNVVY